MTSARPGAVRQRFESRWPVRRGHPVEVTYGSPGNERTVHGVYHHVSKYGWLHLRHTDGDRAIRIELIIDAKEDD